MNSSHLFKPFCNFVAGRPKAALLFWFFGDFRCGVPLFIVIRIGNKYKKGKKKMFIVRLAGDHLYGKIAVHLAVAGDVFDGVFLCCPFSHKMSWMRSGA